MCMSLNESCSLNPLYTLLQLMSGDLHIHKVLGFKKNKMPCNIRLLFAFFFFFFWWNADQLKISMLFWCKYHLHLDVFQQHTFSSTLLFYIFQTEYSPGSIGLLLLLECIFYTYCYFLLLHKDCVTLKTVVMAAEYSDHQNITVLIT